MVATVTQLWWSHAAWKNTAFHITVFVTRTWFVMSVCSDTDLASPLLEFDLDEQNEAHQRHNHEESQEDAHVEIFCGLLWKKEGKRNTFVK